MADKFYAISDQHAHIQGHIYIEKRQHDDHDNHDAFRTVSNLQRAYEQYWQPRSQSLFAPIPCHGEGPGNEITKSSSYTTFMLSMGCAADWKKTPPFPSRRLSSSLRTLVFYNMTKLTEWIVFAGLAFSIWITLLTDILPLKVSYKAKEVIWPVRFENVCKNCSS